MKKYLIFRNQPGSKQANAPGSWEEMACEIAVVVSNEGMQASDYIAYEIENPEASLESLKELAKFTVEIDEESAELWTREFKDIVQKAQNVDNAIGEASGAIYQAMVDYNNAISGSHHFSDLTGLSIKVIDRAFDHFEADSIFEVAAKVEEIYEVESFEDQHAWED